MATSKLTRLRQQQHITQEELAEKSGLSVRTIQRIETGIAPKGHTLKVLAKALGVDEAILVEAPASITNTLVWIKLINISCLLFTLSPPLNILVPIGIMWYKKQFSDITKQIVTLQIIWTLMALLLLIVVQILNDWFGVQSKFLLLIPIGWVLINTVIVLTNAASINQNNTLRMYLKFSFL